MKLQIFGAALLAVMAAGAARAADPPAQYKPQDVISAYSKTQPVCPPRTVPADDGTCDPTAVTRGFSLASPGAKPGAKGAGAAVRAPAGKRVASLGSRPTTSLQPSVAPGDLLISFELGSANLTAQARSNAKSFAEALNAPELSSHRFVLNGHTDASGSSQTNATLSQARAESVKSFLVAQGVDAKRLDAKGYGSAKPIDPRHPTASVNRRVEGLRLD
jgi:OOP family OmpA-OmpF porin